MREEKKVSEYEVKDFEELDIGVLQSAMRALHNRRATKIQDRMRAIMADEKKAVARALTESPYVYMTPEIKIMGGCKIRLSSMIKAQIDDAHEQLDHFIGKERPNDVRVGDYLNKCLLAHSLVEFNGQDFGGVRFDAEVYGGLCMSDPEAAKGMLSELRNQRFRALSLISPHIHDRILLYYNAFQAVFDEMSVDDAMGEILGN